MADAHSIMQAEIVAEYGARSDMRIWPNVSSKVWVGKRVTTLRNGDVILRGARMIRAGLCVGSSDIIGIAPGGRFLGLEVKTGKASARKNQRAWLKLVRDLGGVADVVRSPEDVELLLRRR